MLNYYEFMDGPLDEFFTSYLYFDVLSARMSGGFLLLLWWFLNACVYVDVFAFVLSSFKHFIGNYQSEIKFTLFLQSKR